MTFEILDKFNTNIDNEKKNKNDISNINPDKTMNKMLKNNIVFYRNIRKNL